MLESLKIQGFRCFDHFEIDDLTRVNLIVGRNNSGKSVLLEAIEALRLAGYLEFPFARSMERRGEIVRGEYAVSHLFAGHRVTQGSSFGLAGLDDSSEKHVRCTIDGEFDDRHQIGLALRVESTDSRASFALTAADARIDYDSRPDEHFKRLPAVAPLFITPASLTPAMIGDRWQKVALNPEEQRVVEAVRLIDPKIEQLAWVGGVESGAERAGMAVKYEGVERRIPIGSLGEGIWRMLGLALALAHSANGTLLLDDIDTGLHHTVMADMWRMVLETSKRLNVQVFATTHSRDCVEGLGAICGEDTRDLIRLHRIEPGEPRSIKYSDKQITIAAERGIEVR